MAIVSHFCFRCEQAEKKLAGEGVAMNQQELDRMEKEKALMKRQLAGHEELGGALADILQEENREWERKYNLLEKTLNQEIENKHKDCEDLREELKQRREEIETVRGSPSKGRRSSLGGEDESPLVDPRRGSMSSPGSPDAEGLARELEQERAEVIKLKAEMAQTSQHYAQKEIREKAKAAQMQKELEAAQAETLQLRAELARGAGSPQGRATEIAPDRAEFGGFSPDVEFESAESARGQEWQCPSCTYLNGYNSTACEMCGQQR